MAKQGICVPFLLRLKVALRANNSKIPENRTLKSL